MCCFTVMKSIVKDWCSQGESTWNQRSILYMFVVKICCVQKYGYMLRCLIKFVGSIYQVITAKLPFGLICLLTWKNSSHANRIWFLNSSSSQTVGCTAWKFQQYVVLTQTLQWWFRQAWIHHSKHVLVFTLLEKIQWDSIWRILFQLGFETTTYS